MKCAIGPAREAPTDDVTAIGRLSSVAAAAFAILVLAASPSLLDVDDFADLAMASDPASPTPATVACPLAQPGRTRGHAVRLRGAAACTGPAALAG